MIPPQVADSAQKLQAYQSSEVGSREFKMRLLELVALAIHQIGVLLFNLQPKLHNGDIDAVLKWKPEDEWERNVYGTLRRTMTYPDPRPTFFFHCHYVDYDQYPNGLADGAGYWAEDRIIGGIILFDRGETGLEVSCFDQRLTLKMTA